MRKSELKCKVLVISGILLLSGCGADKTDENADEKEQMLSAESETVQDTQDDKKELQTAEGSVENTTENQVSDNVQLEITGSNVPTIAITQDRNVWYTDDGEVLLLEAEASRVEVISEGFDVLKASLSAQWNGLGNYDEELEWAKEHYDSLDKEEKSYFPSYMNSENVVISRIDNQVISLCDSYYDYSGGAHGTYGNIGRTFDVQSGEELQLEDILSDSRGFYDKAVAYILENLEKNYGEELFPEYEETVRTYTFGETPVSWYLDNTGIVIDYDLYMVTPYAAGAPSVTLPYDEFASYIREDYVKPADSVIVRVAENEDFSRLIGEDGEVMIESVWNEEYGVAEITVVSGSERCEVDTFSGFRDAYVIKRENGRSFVIFVCDYASDDFVTYVYEVTGGKVRECDKLNGAAFSGVSYGSTANSYMGMDKIGLFMHLDVLGTYAGEMVYQLTEDGKLIQTEEVFAIDTLHELTTVKELPVTLGGEETTIQAGRKIKITGTDNAGTAYFRLDTGETGMIQYVRDDGQWQLLIDGVSENEYFEMVPYSG